MTIAMGSVWYHVMVQNKNRQRGAGFLKGN